MASLTGSGTLYDQDENELSPVTYRIDHDTEPGEPIVDWTGELNFDTVPDVGIEPGRYVLSLEDGTRGEIEIEPAGAASAAEGQIAFTGDGVLDLSESAGKALYLRWLDLWNGDFDVAPAIVAAGCEVHQAPFGQGRPPDVRGPAGIVRMVKMGRAPFREITFRLDVGPLLDGDYLAARWRAEGTYAGGLPGATAPAGREITFHGHDILRVEGGKIAEYWVSSDGAYLMAQFGML